MGGPAETLSKRGHYSWGQLIPDPMGACGSAVGSPVRCSRPPLPLTVWGPAGRAREASRALCRPSPASFLALVSLPCPSVIREPSTPSTVLLESSLEKKKTTLMMCSVATLFEPKREASVKKDRFLVSDNQALAKRVRMRMCFGKNRDGGGECACARACTCEHVRVCAPA